MNRSDYQLIKHYDFRPGRFYERNTPLFWSAFSGIFYFFLCWAIAFDDKGNLFLLLLFLPGCTFPLCTSYFHVKIEGTAWINIVIHFILSVVVYIGCTWLFCIGDKSKILPFGPGFLGSLLFLLSTRGLLKQQINLIAICITALLSGLAFLLIPIINKEGIAVGTSMLIWTLVNEGLMNAVYRKSLMSP